jgi:hypothetical protein
MDTLMAYLRVDMPAKAKAALVQGNSAFSQPAPHRHLGAAPPRAGAAIETTRLAYRRRRLPQQSPGRRAVGGKAIGADVMEAFQRSQPDPRTISYFSQRSQIGATEAKAHLR